MRVGDNYILESEFVNRLNFTPKEGIQDRNSSDGIKTELLYTLIAEKLWANYALEEGLDSIPLSVAAKNVIEKMFVRDELYKVEIKDKINIPSTDFENAYIKYNTILETNIFFTSEHSKILSLGGYISKNSSMEDVIRFADSLEITVKNLEISFGDLNNLTEDKLYELTEGEYSKPIEMESIWNIFHLSNKKEREYQNNIERRNAIREVEKILMKRSEDLNYNIFHEHFFKDKKVDVDGNSFKIIAQHLSNLFASKEQDGRFTRNNKDEKVISYEIEDSEIVLSEIGEKHFSNSLVRFAENPISLKAFLTELSFLSFSVSRPDYESVKIKLNRELKEYIKNELLAREGIKRGLTSNPNVKKWVKIWFDNFLYKYVRNNILGSDNVIFSVSKNSDTKESLFDDNNEDKLFKMFIDKTIELSEKYIIEIDSVTLSNIEQSNINLFVYRNLGFGGTIAGVPSSPPFINWYLEKQKRGVTSL